MDKLLTQLETLPERLGGHVFLSLTALVLGVCLSVPVGILAIRRPWLERVSLLFASVVQTIPGLALLALMVFVWGKIGWIPALVALTLYSVLPVLRNTITGLKEVDPAVVEAGKGVGMSDMQILRYVLLPLALPTMVAGIRTAAVWVVGAATIAQPVGATSLGNYIFVGLQTFNFTAILVGCVLSALLALSLDGLLYSLEVAIQKRQRWRLIATGLGGGLLAILPWMLQFASFGGSDQITTSASERGKAVQSREFVIGSKPFTEQYILADLIRSRLREAGVPCKTRDGMGSAFVFNALKQGEVDCYVDYTGTIWTNFMKRDEAQSPMETLVDVGAHLRSEHGLICVGPIGFSNEYVFAMRRADAERLKVASLSDLAKHAPQLVIGTDVEFFDRPEWTSVRKAYGLKFEKETAIDATLMYGAIDSGQLDVIVAYNTDSRIDRYDLQVIEDPKYSLPPYDAILLINSEMARDPQAMKALRPLVQAIDSNLMRKANGMVDVDAKEVADASRFLLESLD